MANVLKHRFTSAKTDGGDATQVQPSHWNDGHAFSGGVAGNVLTRDPTDAVYGAKWVSAGDWVTYPFNTVNFVGTGGMTWTVGSAAVIRNRYAVVNKLMFWSFYLSWFSGSNVLSGTPAAAIRIAMPGGYTLANSQTQIVDFCAGISGAPTIAGLYATSGSNYIEIAKSLGGNFALADIPGMIATITLEVQ